MQWDAEQLQNENDFLKSDQLALSERLRQRERAHEALAQELDISQRNTQELRDFAEQWRQKYFETEGQLRNAQTAI